MTEKHDHTKHDNPCLEAAKDDEPLFVLRAQDALAPLVIEEWVRRAHELRCNQDKIVEANDTIIAMRVWAKTNGKKLPD